MNDVGGQIGQQLDDKGCLYNYRKYGRQQNQMFWINLLLKADE